jgi:hypothetical protein
MQRTRSALTKAQQDAQFLQELNHARVPALNTTPEKHVPDEAFMRRTAAHLSSLSMMDAAYLLSQQEMCVPPLKYTFGKVHL